MTARLPAFARAGSDSAVPPSKAAEETSDDNDEFSSSRKTCALVHSVAQRFPSFPSALIVSHTAPTHASGVLQCLARWGGGGNPCTNRILR